MKHLTIWKELQWRFKDGTISRTGLTLVFKNNSDKEFIYGDYFLLERKVNNDWYEVAVTIEGDYGFNDIGYEVLANQESEWEADWQWLYDELDPGQYRIIKDVSDFRATGDFDKGYLAAEFEINE